MRSRLVPSTTPALVLALAASLLVAGVVMAAETTVTAQLSGSGDTDEDGTGTATIVLDPDAGTACWQMSAENIDPVTVSHIHVGAEGADGPVVVDLDVDGFDGSSEGCNDAADSAALQAIIDDPAGHYVNLHTEPFPMGAIRGQLAIADTPDTAMAVQRPSIAVIGALVLLMAVLLGGRAMRTRPRRS